MSNEKKPIRFLRWPQVHERVGRSRTSIWRDEKHGDFPKRRKIGKNSVVWIESEINAWMTKISEGSSTRD